MGGSEERVVQTYKQSTASSTYQLGRDVPVHLAGLAHLYNAWFRCVDSGGGGSVLHSGDGLRSCLDFTRGGFRWRRLGWGPTVSSC